MIGTDSPYPMIVAGIWRLTTILHTLLSIIISNNHSNHYDETRSHVYIFAVINLNEISLPINLVIG